MQRTRLKASPKSLETVSITPSSFHAGAASRSHHFEVSGYQFRLPTRFTPLKLIGRGASGIIISATDQSTGEIVAIKKCPLDIVDDPRVAGVFLREVSLLQFVNHPNVMGLKDLPLPPPPPEPFDAVYMVMEKMDADLSVVLATQRLSPDHVIYFMYQLLRGVRYLHSANIVHRDLKPANVLVNAQCDLKITDFGLSRGIDDADGPPGKKKMALTAYVATRQFRAPEIMLSSCKYGKAVDLWAVGCIFGQLLTPSQGILFPGKDYLRVLTSIFALLGTPAAGDSDYLPAGCSVRARAFVDSLPRSDGSAFGERFLDASEEALDLLRALLTVNPARRITAETALQHPFFRRAFDEADVAGASGVAPTPFTCPFHGSLPSLLVPTAADGEGEGKGDGDHSSDNSSNSARAHLYRMALSFQERQQSAATAATAAAASAVSTTAATATAAAATAVAASASAAAATTTAPHSAAQ